MTSPLKSPESFRWEFAPSAPSFLRQSLADGTWAASAVLIKRNRLRQVYRVPGSPGMVVKVHSPPGWFERLKARWRPSGRREYESSCLARDRGLAVPAPLGYGVRGVETLSAAVDVGVCDDLAAAWARVAGEPRGRARLLEALVVFARSYASAGLRHPDLHAGNILVADGPAGPRCVLVDLAGVRPCRDRSAWAVAGWVTQLAPSLRRREVSALLSACGAVEPGGDAQGVYGDLLRRQARSAARRWPGRRRRLLEESSLCQCHRDPDGLWRLFRPFSLEAAREALRQHRAQVSAGRLLKDDRKRRLSRVEVGGVSYVVKEFLEPGRGPWRADRRSWLNHYRLAPGRFPVCRCHAWLAGRDGGVLVLEDVGARHLQAASGELPAPSRRPLLASAAQLLAALHSTGAVPHDLKATNFVEARHGEPRGAVCMVDADAVRFWGGVRPVERVRALGQFLGNLPAAVSRRERLRFAVEYRREAGLTPAVLRRLLAALPATSGAAVAARARRGGASRP